MVATSLPFWMHHSSRVMSPFLDHMALRADPFAADEARRVAGLEPPPIRRPPLRLTVEFCDALAMQAHERAWVVLAARALEPNVFLEPGFALPALRHFPPAQWPLFLLVWSTDQAGIAALVGLCAFRPPAILSKLIVGWIHALSTASIPLLDRDRAGEALDLILETLAARWPDGAGLLIEGLSIESPLMALIEEQHRQAVDVDRRMRVVLRRPSAQDGTAEHKPSGRHAKELRRQARRLHDRAPWTYARASDPDEVRAATERFLDLEARGWKGGRGTALLNDAGLAAFTRAMTRRLARAGLCRIDTLEIGGHPAAMGIVLRSGDRAFFWKTAYDESLAHYSPGKLFADMLGRAQREDTTIALTDSCAVPDHPMIGHVWGDRMDVADVIVAAPGVDTAQIARGARILRYWRRLREGARTVRDWLRRD